MCGRIRRSLILAAVLFPWSAPAVASETDPGWLPIRYAGRPLTLVDGLFRLDFFVGGGRIERSVWALELSAGAGYGVSDDLEVGLVLLDAVISPSRSSGLVEPSGYVRYRLLDAGFFQAGAELSGQVPTEGRWAFTATTPILLAAGRWVRLDVLPRAELAQRPDWQTSWRIDGTLSVQILDRWRVFAGARIGDRFGGGLEPLVQPIGGAALTIGPTRQPTGDFELVVQGPATRLAGESPIARDLDSDWFALVAFRPFMRGEGSRSVDPFDDPDF